MAANPKSTKDAASHAAKAEAFDVSSTEAVAALIHKGIERFADLQRNRLNVFSETAMDIFNTWKGMVPAPQATPGMILADVGVQSIDRFVEMQKNMLDLMVQQSEAVLDSMNQRGDPASKMAGGMAELVRDTTDMSIAAQKIAWDFTAQQNKAVTDAVKRQPGVSGTPAETAADSLQRGMNAIIDTQKELVEIAAKPLTASATKM